MRVTTTKKMKEGPHVSQPRLRHLLPNSLLKRVTEKIGGRGKESHNKRLTKEGIIMMGSAPLDC